MSKRFTFRARKEIRQEALNRNIIHQCRLALACFFSRNEFLLRRPQTRLRPSAQSIAHKSDRILAFVVNNADKNSG